MCRPVRHGAICRCTLGTEECRLALDETAARRVDGAPAAGVGDRRFAGTFGDCTAGAPEAGAPLPCRPLPEAWMRARNAPDGDPALLTDFDLLPCRRGGTIAIIVGSPCDASGS